MARPFRYRCPIVGSAAQAVVEGEPRPDDESRQYEAVKCAACGRLHLVNLATLKLLSDEQVKRTRDL